MPFSVNCVCYALLRNISLLYLFGFLRKKKAKSTAFFLKIG